jgi:hypothetical protein
MSAIAFHSVIVAMLRSSPSHFATIACPMNFTLNIEPLLVFNFAIEQWFALLVND